MNSGRIATAVGNSSPNANSVNSASRPRNCNRAKTKAAIDANTTATTTEMTAITRLLPSSPSQKSALDPNSTSW